MTLALSLALVAYLLLASPVLGKRAYDRLAAARAADPGVYRRMFGLWCAELWLLAAAALVIVASSPDLGTADLGLALTEPLGDTLGTVSGFLIAAAVSTYVLHKFMKDRPLPGQDAVVHLMPHTKTEHWYAAGLSVTAGITEEIVYRGLLIAVGMSVFGLDQKTAAAAALAVFAIGHLYQGWHGMVMVTLAGLGLTLLYLRTGSLLLPILLHILIDLRGLVLLAPKPKPQPVGLAA